jgi:hypothetical protein
MVRGLSSNQKGVYKIAKPGAGGIQNTEITGKMLVGPAINKGLGGQAGVVEAFQGNTMHAKYIDEYMSQISSTAKRISSGKTNFKFEAAMQRQAREELGNVVPAVLGETRQGFIQEFAGVPLPYDKRSIPALEKMRDIWGDLLTRPGERVRHFDPQIENVVRQGTKLRMIDFGVAGYGPSLSRQSQDAAEDILERYVKVMRRELDPGSFTPPSGGGGLKGPSTGAGRPAAMGPKTGAGAPIPLNQGPSLSGAPAPVRGGDTGPPQPMHSGPAPVRGGGTNPPQPRPSVKQRLAEKHQESVRRASKNAKDPGNRHRRHTTTGIIS